jgi:hypothetical protein
VSVSVQMTVIQSRAIKQQQVIVQQHRRCTVRLGAFSVFVLPTPVTISELALLLLFLVLLHALPAATTAALLLDLYTKER